MKICFIKYFRMSSNTPYSAALNATTASGNHSQGNTQRSNGQTSQPMGQQAASIQHSEQQMDLTSRGSSIIRCFTCGRIGHRASRCWHNGQNSMFGPQQPTRSLWAVCLALSGVSICLCVGATTVIVISMLLLMLVMRK